MISSLERCFPGLEPRRDLKMWPLPMLASRLWRSAGHKLYILRWKALLRKFRHASAGEIRRFLQAAQGFVTAHQAYTTALARMCDLLVSIGISSPCLCSGHDLRYQAWSVTAE